MSRRARVGIAGATPSPVPKPTPSIAGGSHITLALPIPQLCTRSSFSCSHTLHMITLANLQQYRLLVRLQPPPEPRLLSRTSGKAWLRDIEDIRLSRCQFSSLLCCESVSRECDYSNQTDNPPSHAFSLRTGKLTVGGGGGEGLLTLARLCSQCMS